MHAYTKIDISVCLPDKKPVGMPKLPTDMTVEKLPNL